MPIGDVLNKVFVGFFLFSVVAVYFFFVVDRFAYRRRFLESYLSRFTISEPIAFLIMRCAVAAFFAAISVWGFSGDAFYLTPELRTDQRWVPWLQAALALCALHRWTMPLMAVGMAVLYGAAIRQYGLFHLLDYLILVGVTYYFLVSPIDRPGWKKSRYIVMYAATGLTLLWASIEKWGYPAWTFPLFESDPSLLMGLDPAVYMVLAGFVEFNLTFVLLSSSSLFSRAIALGLMSVFVLAIAKFGMIDDHRSSADYRDPSRAGAARSDRGPEPPGARNEIAVDRGLFHDRPLRARVRADLHRLLRLPLAGVPAADLLRRSCMGNTWGN
jgi:hypothetical protein